jgi:uncharacterized membrane protein
MNLAHLHVLLNHFPTIGTIVGFGLFLVALVWKSEDLKRASLGVFVVIALVSIPAYLSGNAAQLILENAPDVAEATIEAHENAALLASIFMGLTGLISWLVLWQYRRLSNFVRWNMPAVLVLSAVTVGLMARAANLGGEINHPEIRPDSLSGPQAGWLQTAVIASSFVFDNPWVWPINEIFHFVGLCILFGVVLLVNLRMLGVLKGVSFAALHRLLPWVIVGFVINVVSGMLFFVANHAQYVANPAFHWKVALMVLAGVNFFYVTVYDEGWALGPDDNASVLTKVLAVSSIVLWVGVILFGRWLPYLGSE